jgi:hypothetical protein
VKLDLPGGLGISLVSSQPAEELLFAHLTGINMELVSTGSQQKLNLTVKDIQCDNQLFEAQCPVVVYGTPPSARSKDAEAHRTLPVLRISTERVPNLNSNVATYKVLQESNVLKKLIMFENLNHFCPQIIYLNMKGTIFFLKKTCQGFIHSPHNMHKMNA